MSTPEQLGKYKIVRVLGKGAMGIVYEGFDPVIERTVAIKTIRVDELDPEEAEEHSRRFKVEAKAAGKLNHPNIVGIYDYGEEQSLAYIVMEYVQGKELKSYLDSGQKFPIKQTVHIMGQLLEALGYSHDRGVIHRDIKPANLFITDNGMVKLGDFGIARIDSTHKTHAGTVLGTPSYMSPEQIKGETVDNRSDLYSCGVILYQFLTGEKPFTGSMVAVMHKVLAEDPPKPSSINPQVTPQLEQVLFRAMAKRPEDRYANASEFFEALRTAAGMDKADDDAEATRVIKLSDVMSATQAADQTARTAAVEATGLAGRTANQGENDIEIEFWRSIKDSTDTDDFDIYLKKYPQGHYAELAQIKLNKLRRSETTQTGTHAAAEATASSRTGGSRIEDIRRKAEEARRKAEEEMREAEAELQRAEAAQFKAEEEARQKVEDAAAETATLSEAATAFGARVAEILDKNAVKETRDEVRSQAGQLERQAAGLQSRLQESLKTQELLQADSLAQANQANDDCGAAMTVTREALQRYEVAFKKRLDEVQHNVEIITRHGHEAAQVLQEVERLAGTALESGTTAQALAEVKAATERLCVITGDARKHIEVVLQDQDLLQPEVLKTIHTAESAYGRAEDKAQETVAKVETALREAEEAAKRQAEAEARRKAEAEAQRKAEEEARRKADEEAKRQAEAEAKRKAEEEARRKAEEEAKRKADEEAKRQAEEEAKRKAEEEAKRQAEAEARRKAEEDAKRKAAEEAKRKAEEEARRKAEEEAKLTAEETAKLRADEEARRKAEEEAKRQAEAEAKRKAEEEAQRRAEEEAKRKAAEEAKRKSDEEAKRKAAEEAKRKSDEEAKRKAAEEAKRKSDEEAKRKAAEETKRKSDEEARRRAEEQASDETLVIPTGKRPEPEDSDATIMAAPAARPRAAEAVPRAPEKPAVAQAPTAEKKGLPIVPIAIGGVLVAGVVGWLLMKGPSEPSPQAPTPPVAMPTPEQPAPPPVASAETQAANKQAEAAGQATLAAQQQAEEQQRKLAEAQKAAEDAQRKIEEAKRMGDAKQAQEAQRKAEEEMRQAEAQRKAAEESQRKAAEEARRRAAEEARLKADAEARQKAEAEAQRKAADAEAKRKAAADAEAQRKTAADAEAQRKAAVEAEAQRKAAAEEQAKAKPTVTASVAPSDLFQQGRSLEGDGRYAEAVRLYKQAGNAGHGPASKRLGEIYLKGAKGVSRDYAESVRWYAKARQQGMDIPN